jgi:hypothetical protein
MKEVVFTVGIIVLGIIGSFVVTLRSSLPQAQKPDSLHSAEPTTLVADAPPSDDRGTPGRRS